MGANRPREERRTILLQARLRGDDGWRDAEIANVSSKGLMIRCLAPPPRATFVEIRHRGVCIIGRVMWSRGTHCGVRAQDEIDIGSLAANSPRKTTKPMVELRAVSAKVATAARTSLAVQADASRRTARLMHWITIAAAGAVAATIVASTVTSALQASLEEAHDALSAQPRLPGR